MDQSILLQVGRLSRIADLPKHSYFPNGTHFGIETGAISFMAATSAPKAALFSMRPHFSLTDNASTSTAHSRNLSKSLFRDAISVTLHYVSHNYVLLCFCAWILFTHIFTTAAALYGSIPVWANIGPARNQAM